MTLNSLIQENVFWTKRTLLAQALKSTIKKWNLIILKIVCVFDGQDTIILECAKEWISLSIFIFCAFSWAIFPFACLLSPILMYYYILFFYYYLLVACCFPRRDTTGLDLYQMEYMEELQVLHEEDTITRVYYMKKSIFNKREIHMEIPT